MSLLFNVMPDDPVQAKKKARKKIAAAAPEQDSVGEFLPSPPRPQRTLGSIEGMHVCADESCGAEIHDIIDEDGGYWVLECMFCGTKQRAKAIKGYLKPKEKEFTFPSGEYEGMSIIDVAAEARGMSYIEWAAEEHKNPSVKAACQKHLDSTRLPE